jgi:amino acid transporter
VLRALLLASLFAALAFVNIRGIKPGIRLVETITIAKLSPLFLLIAVGVWHLNPQNLSMALPAVSEVGRASIVLIFAFVGVEVALTPSGEILNPAGTVPRSILFALGISTIIYLAIQTVAQGILGAELPSYTNAPLAEAARRILGNGGRLALLAGATVGTFGYVAGDMLGTPRALYAVARDGALPSALAKVHPRYHTPALAIAIYAMLVAGLAISSTFERLVIMANVSAMFLYLLCVAASYELQRRDVRMGGTPFNLPGGGLIQLLAGAGIVWLVAQATPGEFAVEAVVIAVGTLYYLVRRKSIHPLAASSSSSSSS